jgi:hypothetical protein
MWLNAPSEQRPAAFRFADPREWQTVLTPWIRNNPTDPTFAMESARGFDFTKGIPLVKFCSREFLRVSRLFSRVPFFCSFQIPHITILRCVCSD